MYNFLGALIIINSINLFADRLEIKSNNAKLSTGGMVLQTVKNFTIINS